MKNKQELKQELSRTLITETALRLFADNGFERTTIRNIAEAAGISLGLMYNYFNSKDELLLEIFRQGSEDIKASFTNFSEEQLNMSGVERHIRQTVKILKEKRNFWKLLHGIRMQSPVVQQLLAEMREQTKFIEIQIRKYLADSGIAFPDLEAKLLFASIDGMAHHYLLYDNYPIDDIATLLIMKYRRQ
ncbi:TetR/AcrR family transcriptional regulator [Botryobacter ruber]|uniref:TetR/AcrR family transcriptional regulator n=1 Tax=Botryobacter ruber TaxID=2171629 RepID=UPI000E0B9D4F|nr:TetR/AcrR family transcriptional regulator [Botryobacter ruber]